MAVQFIRRMDIASLEEATNLLTRVSADFIAQLPGPRDDNNWMPENTLGLSYSKNLIDILSTLLNVADVTGLRSVNKVVLNASFSVANQLRKRELYFEAKEFLVYWRTIAYESISSRPELFAHLVNFHYQIAVECLGVEAAKELLYESLRNLGWLGEQLLISRPLAEEPIMGEISHITEFDALLEAVLQIGGQYTRNYSSEYPLIFFDATYVIIRQLAKLSRETPSAALDEKLTILYYEYRSFARAAFKVGNSDGALLAMMQIHSLHKEFRDWGLTSHARESLCMLVDGAIDCAGYQHLSNLGTLGDPMEWVLGKLAISHESIDSFVREGFIRSGAGEFRSENVLSFVKRLGQKMGTNFGLQFDFRTGETYSDEDSRRR